MQKVEIYIKNIGKIPLILIVSLLLSFKAYTQDIGIFTGKTTLSLNEYFTLTIYFPRDYKKEYKNFNQFFPDITDFVKDRTLYTDDNESKGYKIIQYYKPYKPGNYIINPVQIRIKDKVIATERVSVRVLNKYEQNPDPLPEIKLDDDLEFKETKPEVFLDFQISQKKVFTGEGFGVSLAFFISEQNKAEITFIELGEQRKEIIKKIRTTGCLTEDFIPSEMIAVDTVRIKGKKYSKWKLYEGTLYPIDSNNVRIPSFSFRVITYARARNGHQSMERKRKIRVFSTKPSKVEVKSLPGGSEHLPVGYFRLKEEIDPKKFQTGKSFKYSFMIMGEGNIAALPEPVITQTEYFDIYAPKVRQETNRQQGKVFGAKSFTYYITPKEPGTFHLRDFFKWSYFNVSGKRIDTLSSAITLKVRGESLKNNYISTSNPGDFYNRIYTDDNNLLTLAKDDTLKFLVNIVILMMLVVTAVLVLKK